MSTRTAPTPSRRYAIPARAERIEHRHAFDCFGGRCTVIVADADRPADAAAAAAMAKRALLAWHHRFSRFQADSELSRLNRNPGTEVRVSPLMRRVIEVAIRAARDTGGLVDATLGAEIERAGYASHLEGDGIPLPVALALAPPRAPASPHPAARWAQIAVDRERGVVRRPPGMRIDPGGIAKGVFADELATLLEGFDAYALDCCGDLRVGGRAGLARAIVVAGPVHAAPLHTFSRRAGAAATSGIGRRSWLVDGGLPAHHLLDPARGTPAFTGIVQATALAPTAARAEVLAKAAILSGPARAAEWLTDGGVIVFDDGAYEVVEPAASRPVAELRVAGPPQISSRTASRSGSSRISWKSPDGRARVMSGQRSSSAQGTTTASSWGESRATT
jgi:thiamine biosynthesis lipoprotein